MRAVTDSCRCLGWLPALREDTPSRIHQLFSSMPIGSIKVRSLPAAYLDMESDIGYIQDQPDQSCVAQALTGITEVRSRRLGVSLPRLSALAAYTGGRVLGGNSNLLDIGSRAPDVVRFMSSHGVVPEDRWPSRDFNGVYTNLTGTPLPPDVFQHAVDAKVGDYYWLTGSSLNLADQIATTIWNDIPVAFAGPADDSLMDLGPDGVLPNDLQGNIHGGHMMSLHGFAEDAYDPFGYRFRGRNSWGTSWGDNGFFWISASRLVRYYAEFLAISVTPKEAT